jgi:hypothetical protein
MDKLTSAQMLDAFLRRLLAAEKDNYKVAFTAFTGGHNEYNGITLVDVKLVLDKLINDGFVSKYPYIDPMRNTTLPDFFYENYVITLEGKIFIENVGYETKMADEDRLAEISKRKMKVDVKNAERIAKTYWWTFGFALVALLISLVLLVLKLRD